MLPMWNLEMMIKSRMMLTTNLTELMISGTSGLSSARVEALTAYSTAELNAENAEIRTYVTLTSLTSTGTKPFANVEAPATKPMLIIRPRRDWKRMRVSVSCSRSRKPRLALSPMTRYEARGNPSFKTSATTPMYVYVSVVTTIEESILATHSFDKVP